MQPIKMRKLTRMPFRNPVPTVDIIIEITRDNGPKKGIVLVKRKNPPAGWALPGGFVDYGESLETAAVREAREETSLEVELLGQLHTYSDPERDPRFHTVSTVFLASASGIPHGGDDAREAVIFNPEKIGVPLAFDHRQIIEDYIAFKRGKLPWTKKKKKRIRSATRISKK